MLNHKQIIALCDYETRISKTFVDEFLIYFIAESLIKKISDDSWKK
jgi:hypothetical protein